MEPTSHTCICDESNAALESRSYRRKVLKWRVDEVDDSERKALADPSDIILPFLLR
jgi:hypothetical protein